MKEIYLKQNTLFLTPDNNKTTDNIINNIKNVLKNTDIKKLQINLCGFNVIETIKLITILSAKILEININIRCAFVVDSEITKSQIKPFLLSNSKIFFQESIFAKTNIS